MTRLTLRMTRWMTAVCAITFATALVVHLQPAAGGRIDPSSREGTHDVNDPESVQLIPRSLFFGNPQRAGLQISPDGTYLSFLAPRDGVMNIWVGPVDDPDRARPVTNETHRGISSYFWAYTSGHVLYTQDVDGNEDYHLYVVDLESGEIRDLTPIEGITARVQEVSDQFPTELLVGINDRESRQLHDIYRLDILTGERELLLANPGFVGFVTDEQFEPRFAVQILPDASSEIFEYGGNGSWESFLKVGPEDMMSTQPVAFDKSGEKLYMIDSRGRNTAALKMVDLASGDEEILFANDRADVGMIMRHPTEKHVQAVSSSYRRRQWEILDPEIRDDIEYLRTVADGEWQVTSRTQNDHLWTVAYIMDDGPVRYYLYDRTEEQARFLFTSRPELDELPLAPMYDVVIPSRDGLNLVSYLTLPVWSDPDESGRPGEPVPMVLLVHGGPWSRDSWGYDPLHQLLANRGYAVLSVNFRGSTGLGKDFLNAGDGAWAAEMHDDLIDAVKWAVDEHIADPERVGIMGGSYGGYATLVGLTFTPEVFACGVDIVGPSNLVTLLQNPPPYWMPMMPVMQRRVGDYTSPEGLEFLRSRSPLFFVDRIERPLLIGQGKHDPRVKQIESDQIVEAMQERGIPVTYLLFNDEGHGFQRPENRLAFFAVTEAFLARHLGGRRQPIGDAFEGANFEVPAGRDEVPELDTTGP